MIKFLKNFFKLGKPSIYDEIENPKDPNEINTSTLYKQMRKYSAQNQTEEITSLIYIYSYKTEKFINGCKEQAIIDGDLILFKELFLRQRKHSFGINLMTDNILNYALKAFKQDKTNVFEYLIDYYHSQYSNCISYSNEYKVRNLIDNICENHGDKYLKILKEYNLNFNEYIESILEHYPNEKSSINKILFLCDNFPHEINKEKLLLKACEAQNPNQILIKFLIENGTNIYCNDGVALLNVGRKRCVDIVEDFMKNSTDKHSSLDRTAALCAQIKSNLEVVQCFVKNGAVVDLDKYEVDRESYVWLKKWSDSEKLSKELTEELKPSIEVKKPKKMKV